MEYVSSTPRRNRKKLKHSNNDDDTFSLSGNNDNYFSSSTSNFPDDENVSLWWDDLDVHRNESYDNNIIDNNNHNNNKKDEEENGIVIVDKIPLPFSHKIINLYNSRCIIHRINYKSFQNLKQIFEEYYGEIMKILTSSEEQFDNLKRNLHSFSYKGKYIHSNKLIFALISEIIAHYFEKNRNFNISQLRALSNFIIAIENYLNFQSKCLFDFYHTVIYGLNFNLYKSALAQWKTPSENSSHLEGCISDYVKRSKNFLEKIKNDERETGSMDSR